MLVPADVPTRWRRLELTVWALLLSFAFYPGPWGFLAWISLVRPIWIIAELEPSKATRSAYLFGLLFNLFSLYWIAVVTVPGTVAAILIVAWYYAIVLIAFNRIYQWRPLYGIILLPFLWTGMEYWRTLTEFAFPWSDLGYSQAYFLYMIQFVSVLSVHGLSILIVTVNVLLWQVFRKQLSAERRLTSGFAALLVVVGLVAFGWTQIPPYPDPGKFRVALLQGSVSLEEKWKPGNEGYTLNLYDSLAQTVKETNPSLYVWPETAVPCYLTHSRPCRTEVGGIAHRTDGFHLVGAMAARSVGEDIQYYNSCFQVASGGVIVGQYDKVKLVPFSEQVPYQDYLWFLKRDAVGKVLSFVKTQDVQWWSDFRPGDSLKLFSLPEIDYGVLICFESAFPEYGREMVQRGSSFLVGITNDTWFGNTVGTHMHARIFLTRAIENRIWGVRVANSGISYVVDPYGRIRAEMSIGEVGALSERIGLLEEFSLFTRWGDVVGRFSVLILASVLGILLTLWLLRKLPFGR